MPTYGLRAKVRRMGWATLTERKWVICGERRGGDDGVEFNLAGIRGEAIRKDAGYDSVRVLIGAALDKA